ncbi:hypothetical protein [Paludisphaera soli]|uniref:hypothetical protein n=1 Tax=Paludisphaera soli TaxID=2712865 RepID=UPI0013E9BC85|nr:hypothetical protein [Paludisphaera soli]
MGETRSDKLLRAVGDRVSHHRRVSESFRSAAETIGPITKGMHVFSLTRGQFSLLDCILHTLEQIGPAHLSVWAFAVSDYDVGAIRGLMAQSELLSGRLMVDSAIEKRSYVAVEQWRERFGDDGVRVCRNHAKMSRVWNDDFRVLIRGSFNLNYNPRFEQFDLTEGGPEFDLVGAVEDSMPALSRAYTHAEVEAVSQTSQSYEFRTLEMFQGVKAFGEPVKFAGGLKTWTK